MSGVELGMDKFWDVVSLILMELAIGVNAAACMWDAHQGAWGWASMHCGLAVFLVMMFLADLALLVKEK